MTACSPAWPEPARWPELGPKCCSCARWVSSSACPLMSLPLASGWRPGGTRKGMTPTPPAAPTRRGRLARATGSEKVLPFSSVEHGGAILCLLDQHLWLTNDQIELLLFRHGTTRIGKPRSPGGSGYAANTALRRLFDLGLVDRVPAFLPGRSPET